MGLFLELQGLSVASSSPKDRPWGHILLLACIVVGGIYWLFFRPDPVEKLVLPTPAGWDDLASCATMDSLDGTKQIKLSDDQRAELWDLSPLKEGEDPKSHIIEGAWSYDAGSKRYAIRPNEETTTYALLARGEPTTCILFKGDLGTADLRASWFSFPSNEDPRDAEAPPDRR